MMLVSKRQSRKDHHKTGSQTNVKKKNKIQNLTKEFIATNAKLKKEKINELNSVSNKRDKFEIISNKFRFSFIQNDDEDHRHQE